MLSPVRTNKPALLEILQMRTHRLDLCQVVDPRKAIARWLRRAGHHHVLERSRLTLPYR